MAENLNQPIDMTKKLFLHVILAVSGIAAGQAADQFFSGGGTALDSASYASSAAGPFASTFVSGNTWNYAGASAGTGTGGTISIGGLNATQNFSLTAASGTLTATGTMTVSSGITVDLGTQTIAGSAITKAGAGTLTLAGANTFSGTTTIVGGVLRATTSASSLGTSAVDFQGSGTLELANNTGLNYARTISIGANSSVATISSDRLTAGAGVTHTLASLTIGSKTVNIRAGTNVTSGTGGITISGNTALSGASPIFTVASGALLTLNTVSSGNPATIRTITANGAGDMAIIGVIGTGSGAVSQAGTGKLTPSAANTYTGSTSVSAGILRATTNAGALGAGSLFVSGGTLELANNTGLNFGRNTTVSGNATITSDVLTSGSAGVTHSLGSLGIGAQTLTIGKGSNVGSGVAGVTFTGTTTLGGNATFAPAAGTLLTLGAVTGATRSFTVNGAGDVTVSGAVTTTTGTIGKSGAGQLTLSGTNTYSGGTTVNAGTVLLTGTASAGTGAVRLNGGTLSVNINSGSNGIANAVTFTSTSASYQLRRAAGAAFSEYSASSQLGGVNTSVAFLAGSASGVETMTTSFSAVPSVEILSDVFSLNGTGTDTFTLQLTVTGVSSTAYVGWLNGGDWVNAVDGNDASGIYAGFYGMSFAAFLSSHGGSFDAASMLGAYGNDGAGNVWAVLDHNSDFAIVPEPQTWCLLGLGLALVASAWKRRRAIRA